MVFGNAKRRIRGWVATRAEQRRERKEHERERKERLKKLYEEAYEKELTRVHAQEAVKVAQEKARAKALAEARGRRVDWPKWQGRLRKAQEYSRRASKHWWGAMEPTIGVSPERRRSMKPIDDHMRDLIGGRKKQPHIETATQDLIDFQNPYLKKRERR